MTDPYAGSTDPNPGEPTVPAMPEADRSAQAFHDPALEDPRGGSDPWSSGPGLGSSPAADPALEPVATPRVPEPPAPAGPTGPAYPPPAPPSMGAGAPAGSGGAPQQPPTAWPPPQPASAYEQPAPTRQSYYQQPPYAAAYPEPDGPANQIGTPYSPYAPSPYADQRLPAIVDPVAYDYGYGYNQPGAGSPHPQAATSMVLGILGLVAFIPLAPVAWYLAAKARREMDAQPGRWQPSGMLTAGLVLGIIGTALIGLAVVMFFFVIMMAAASF